jgi:DNA-binding beta-propeller fold protein YncE
VKRRGRREGFRLASVLVSLLLAAAGAAGCRRGEASSHRLLPVGVLGGLGTEDGRFFEPRGVAVDPSGNLCVVDRSGRLQWFASDGRFLHAVKLPDWEKGQPTGINFDRKGELLVADSHYQRVLVYAPGGPDAPPALRRMWGGAGAGPGQFTLPRDIVEDAQGYLYVSDYSGPEDRIEKFTPEGEFVLAWGKRGTGDGEFQRPQGMAIERWPGGRETLLVADSCNHRLQRFTLDGRREGGFGRLGAGPGDLKYPCSVAVAPEGGPGPPGIYVADWGNNRIQRFDRDGRPLGSFGGPGRAPGEMATPWDVAVGPDGRLYVADYGNHRVQVFALPNGAAGGTSAGAG